jgi:hypothetical protein
MEKKSLREHVRIATREIVGITGDFNDQVGENSNSLLICTALIMDVLQWYSVLESIPQLALKI